MVRFDDRIWFFWAAWILLIPLNWLMAAAFGALVHELFHVAAVYLLGGRVTAVKICAFGAVIETENLRGIREAFCALAGPLGSLLLVLLIRRLPVLGICALVQGIFNLLPVYPLDGGRALLRLLECRNPERGASVFRCVEASLLCLLLAGSWVISWRYHMGIGPCLLAGVTILAALLRKRP